MAGPGGGPPRKSHTKSRNGCKTCKKRHIRCDETFPQCRNCTKHNCRCDYRDMAAAQGSPPAPRRDSDLLLSPEMEMEVEQWHRTGVPPYPELVQCPRSGWSQLSRSDLRLIHHIVGLSIDLHRRGLSTCTVWAPKMPNFLAIALSNSFVMSSILGLSAFHLAFQTRDQDTKQLAYHHNYAAIQGLQTAIESITKGNSEAILAASILLSWQATDRHMWASLQQAISTVLESMHPLWKQESELAQLVESQRALSASDFTLSPEEDINQLNQTIHALQVVHKRVSHNIEYSQRVGELIEFVQQFRQDSSVQTSEQAFERIQILRQWLFWLPASMLRTSEFDLGSLAILAQFFAVGVVLDRFFPEMGGAYIGALSISPIEDIYNILATHSAAHPQNTELRLSLAIMDLPLHAAARYRNRLAWSPRPSIEHYSPGPSSPYHNLHEYPFGSSSSPASASPSHAAYTPPLQSPPAVTVAGSPFHLADGYVTAAPSHPLYPPSPQLVDTHDPYLALSDLGHSAQIPHSSAYTPPYGDDVLCADMPRADGSIGLNMDMYPPAHFEVPGMAEPCWT
ncbi:hypothetical protein N7492_007285 [Penicillium capsulatum]|uniref:Zn(2)-C6 fungal-type domain-containing protein n=1 Tax=Penicillium capsulatum TaxID=69766 RepID=A0A9W9I1Q3_9EURO|nr:hypothetical protein N7492_007285 [Penicillium capsulatum]KAJ6117125.1 hypothetical protein N7512_006850 [Penicillium capsulatum]